MENSKNRDKDNLWQKFFIYFLKKLVKNPISPFIYFIDGRGKLKAKYISRIIMRDKDLFKKYFETCVKTYGKEDVCKNVSLVIKNKMYDLYRRKIEPIHTLLEVFFTDGYISINKLKKIIETIEKTNTKFSQSNRRER
ncbi:MAG: hypothetical protein QXX12_00750 [Nanopusillaceae archaeon]